MANGEWSDEMKSAAIIAAAEVVSSVMTSEKAMGTLGDVKQRVFSVGIAPTIAKLSLDILDAMDEQLALRRETPQ